MGFRPLRGRSTHPTKEMTTSPRIELIGVPDFPLVKAGDDLAALIATALERAGLRPGTGDVLVVAQKIVSKSEHRFVDLTTVHPSERARTIGRMHRSEEHTSELQSRF